MAATQIMMMRRRHSMENETFLIFHADELTEATPGISFVKNVPRVEVVSLAGWYNETFPHLLASERQLGAGEKTHFERFRGYLCKPASVLAADADVVAFVDNEAMLFHSPFDLMDTDIFNRTGSYLFRDRRLQTNSEIQWYRYAIVAAWKSLNPASTIIPKVLSESPPFTGYSQEQGESAVLLFDKARQPRAAAALKRMLEPDLLIPLAPHIWGDKEYFWLAFAIAELEPGLNPMDVMPIGQYYSDDEICTIGFAIGQLVPEAGGDIDGEYKLFYMNGDAMDMFIKGTWRDPRTMRLIMGTPMRWFDPQQDFHPMSPSKAAPGLVGHCFYHGHRPVLEKILEMIEAYQIAYRDLDAWK
jgi:hypothetical protein